MNWNCLNFFYTYNSITINRFRAIAGRSIHNLQISDMFMCPIFTLTTPFPYFPSISVHGLPFCCVLSFTFSSHEIHSWWLQFVFLNLWNLLQWKEIIDLNCCTYMNMIILRTQCVRWNANKSFPSIHIIFLYLYRRCSMCLF